MSVDRAPASCILGVAGHIDHGKTTLVHALTGVDTDRLPEEKARGITIELGFASMQLPSGATAAVVDMPGHERFVRAMIAGAAGVDALLLVVAANEGVMPQTREHLAIGTLVGVSGGVVALTKCDLAEPELIELAHTEIAAALEGTALSGAQIVPVSARTGQGLGDLRAVLDDIRTRPRDVSGPLLVPIDRAFVRHGFGVIATGTLVSGRVVEGATVLLASAGADGSVRHARVRGLQVHGRAVTEAGAGTRIAVNLAGLEIGEIHRGDWIFAPDELEPTRAFDADVQLLRGSPRSLRRRTRLELAVGASHVGATVTLLDAPELHPGERALVRVTSASAVLVRPGERFVLRGPATMAAVGSTVGGGQVVRPHVERVRRRAVALERARRIFEAGPLPIDRARVELELAGERGLTAAEVFARTLVPAVDAFHDACRVEDGRLVGAMTMRAVESRILDALSSFHVQNPTLQGMDRHEISHHADEALLASALSRLIARGTVERDADRIRRAGWKPRDPDAVKHLDALFALLENNGLTPPVTAEIARSLAADELALQPALRRLVERGSAVRVRNDLYVAASALADLERKLVEWLRAKGTIDAQGFKEITGATRKWAIPLAEYFDHKKLTIRVGDARRLRGA